MDPQVFASDLERHRVRRTLAQFKRKLEEALHLIRRQDETREALKKPIR